jgi:diguanylate cyclase (GGDEF)-like protein
MDVFSWFDNRTLIFCDLLLAVAFAGVFFGMKKTYPNLRGINTIAISFLLGVPGTFLLVSHSIPEFVSVILSNCFVVASFAFLYRGMLRFLGSRRSFVVPAAISVVAIVVLFYFTQIQDQLVPRIVAVAITVGLVRGMIAIELFRKSPTFPSPKIMRLFAASMAFFTALSVNFGIIAILRGGSANPLQSAAISTATLVIGLVSICVTGLFMLVLASSDLIARSKDESQKDSLSGAFNRRGIEMKLAAELQRIHLGNHRLSVALIDVDYFKAINDIQGHAAGDAALRVVSEAISNHLRDRDYLGRYGGDEFLLILPQTPCSTALAITERLSQAVRNLSISSGAKPLTLSIGITEAFPSDDTVSILARADKALYKAKSDGRNCRRVVNLETEDPRHVYRALGLALKHPTAEGTTPIAAVKQPLVQ